VAPLSADVFGAGATEHSARVASVVRSDYSNSADVADELSRRRVPTSRKRLAEAADWGRPGSVDS